MRLDMIAGFILKIKQLRISVSRMFLQYSSSEFETSHCCRLDLSASKRLLFLFITRQAQHSKCKLADKLWRTVYYRIRPIHNPIMLPWTYWAYINDKLLLHGDVSESAISQNSFVSRLFYSKVRICSHHHMPLDKEILTYSLGVVFNCFRIVFLFKFFVTKSLKFFSFFFINHNFIGFGHYLHWLTVHY